MSNGKAWNYERERLNKPYQLFFVRAIAFYATETAVLDSNYAAAKLNSEIPLHAHQCQAVLAIYLRVKFKHLKKTTIKQQLLK